MNRPYGMGKNRIPAVGADPLCPRALFSPLLKKGLRIAAQPLAACQKSLAEFASADANRIKYVFPGDT